jgi:hypothetical protein
MPRLRKCKLVTRDINGGETEVDVRFTETRVGGLSEGDLVNYIQEEENMQKSDYEEEKRQEIKNSLEENTFQFKDELCSSEDRFKEQTAWKDCMSLVSDIQNQIENDENYENRAVDVYVKQLEAVNERFGAYRKWKEDYKKYLQNKKVQQINRNNNAQRRTCSKEKNINSRLAPEPENNQTVYPDSPLFSQLIPQHNRYIVPKHMRNTRNQYYGIPHSSFSSWF